MDKRVVQFVAIAIFILLANLAITTLIGPPQPVAPKKPDAAVAAKPPADGEPPAAAEQAAEDQAETDHPAENDQEAPAKNPADRPAEAPPAEMQPAAELKPAEPAVPERRVSLGSYDPASGYRLLVTLTSQGAAVERVELNQPQYRELEDRSGYLGHLAPADAPNAGGCLVQVVGRGTPAAEAGLEVGDVLTGLGKTTLKSAADLEAALKTTEPGQEIELEGERDGRPLHAKVRLARRPLEIIRPELKSKPVDVIADGHDPLSLLFTLEKVGKQSVAKGRRRNARSRPAGRQLATGRVGRKPCRISLSAAEARLGNRQTIHRGQSTDDAQDSPFYHLLVDVEIRNVSGETSVAYRLDGPTGLPLEGTGMPTRSAAIGARGMCDVVLRFDGNNSPLQIGCLSIADDKAVKPVSETDYPLDFIAVDAQYFSSALMPERKDPTDLWFADVRPIRVGAVPAEKSEKKQTDVSFRLIYPLLRPGARRELKHSYRLFAGPKKPPLLDQYVEGNSNLGELVYYGWFGWVARPMLGMLHAFYMIVHNYGIAIIMLTVLVRGCMLPISRKQASTHQKMQELEPEIKRINEKFKNNSKPAPKPSKSCSASTTTTRWPAACRCFCSCRSSSACTVRSRSTSSCVKPP